MCLSLNGWLYYQSERKLLGIISVVQPRNQGPYSVTKESKTYQ